MSAPVKDGEGPVVWLVECTDTERHIPRQVVFWDRADAEAEARAWREEGYPMAVVGLVREDAP